MRRFTTAILAVATLVPAVAVLTAVSTTPPSAYALPVFEFASSDGPVRVSADQLGAHRGENGLEIDQAKFQAAVEHLQETFRRPAEAPQYHLTEDHTVQLTSGSPGVEVDPDALREMLERALRGSRSNLKLPVKEIPVPPAVSHAIVVTLQDFRLDLYQGAELMHHYVVGVGKLDFPTPPGAYYIRSKARNPTWRNPNSRWSRGMPAFIPPGPRNPLGTRALRLDRDALVIHGTPNPSSVGQQSSHGCIRMKREDVEHLFEIVPEGTPVFIIP